MGFFEKLFDIIFTKKILGTVLVVIFTIIVIKIFNKIISSMLKKGKNKFEIKKRQTIIDLFESIFKYIIWALAILIILDFFGVDTRSLLASLGIAGVVLGLALQDTVKDFISGTSLILENYLSVGDIVTYNNFTGEVIELGLRTTKIKSANGEVMVIANRNIDTIINASQKRSNLLIEIDTAYEEKTEKVEKVLKGVIEKAIEEKIILADSEYLGINELSSSSVKYLIKIHCMQDERYKIKREILGRVKIAYEKNNIKIPYEQIEVHNGQDI